MGNWMILMILGVLGVVAGLMALLNPFGASLTATVIAGWSFLILGALQIYASMRSEGWSSKAWSILMGVVAVILGVSLLANPLEGMIALTIVVGAMFLASGLFKLIVGWSIQQSELKWAVVISGLVSAVLGFMVLSNMPGAAVVTLGVLLGIELLSSGVSMIALALARKAGGVSGA
ncbi:DUF308 domain-containing protein [uncultured Shimia sp.]|uniref:HdeD family acid-resistance protein n=1 Tax=uncultured Shimia sp. TaxID=573152 RepID=UPI0026239318|nr:DUF308 domain-containing protein [uncultured Shimia sp.]